MKNNHFIIFHYRYDKIAGTERVIYNLLEFISQKHQNVTLLLASEKSDLVLNVSKLPVNIVFLGQVANEKNSFNLLLSHILIFFRLCQFLTSIEKKDTICLATNPFLSMLMWLASRIYLRSLKAIIACEHFSIHVSGKISIIVRKLFYKYFYVVTLTEKDRDIIINRFKPLYCTFIPNAIPIKIVKYNFNEANKKILSIGRLSHQKGFDLLISSYSKIAKRFPEWEIIIVGDDYGEKQHLVNLTEKHKLQDKVFIFPATKNIFSYYKNARFYVLSSRFEGLPMVMLEAMAFGLPIVAFNCPTGPAELVDNENGILVENGNIEELASAMELLMTNEKILLKKAIGSEIRAKLYTKERVNKLWENLFFKINNN